jgi:hypothetical protein
MGWRNLVPCRVIFSLYVYSYILELNSPQDLISKLNIRMQPRLDVASRNWYPPDPLTALSNRCSDPPIQVSENGF